MSSMMIDVDTYHAAFTPQAIAGLREFAAATAAELKRSGRRPACVLAEESRSETRTEQRRRLGARIGNRETTIAVKRPLLTGWPLRQRQMLRGQDGDEFYMWHRAAALGEDGQLYVVETHYEEFRGLVTGDNSVKVTLQSDAGLDEWDRVYGDGNNTFKNLYWAVFPGNLHAALAALSITYGAVPGPAAATTGLDRDTATDARSTHIPSAIAIPRLRHARQCLLTLWYGLLAFVVSFLIGGVLGIAASLVQAVAGASGPTWGPIAGHSWGPPVVGVTVILGTLSGLVLGWRADDHLRNR